ncbi:MAG: hypothetical protein H7067_08085 [Burkholderiales bacterium]|nr:hypothetical protein [Opitutaceae bacterium]
MCSNSAFPASFFISISAIWYLRSEISLELEGDPMGSGRCLLILGDAFIPQLLVWVKREQRRTGGSGHAQGLMSRVYARRQGFGDCGQKFTNPALREGGWTV